jgi:hypothetical protein
MLMAACTSDMEAPSQACERDPKNVSSASLLSIRSVSAVERSALEQLADAARLRSSTNETVPVDVAITEGNQTMTIQPTVRLTPKTSLTPGWYVLEVTSLKAPLTWPELAPFEVAGDGSARSRFRVGSEPAVMTILACEKEGGRTKIELELSERVVAAQPLQDYVKLSTNAGPLDCELSASEPETDAIGALCDLSEVTSLRISLTKAFASTSSPSTPAEDSTADFNVELASFRTWSSGCKIYPMERKQ